MLHFVRKYPADPQINFLTQRTQHGLLFFLGKYPEGLMVYAFMGEGVKYRIFLPNQNFHEKNEGIAKTLIICDGNLLAQLLIQKFHLGVKRNMPHVTPKSAVLYPPPPINLEGQIQ